MEVVTVDFMFKMSVNGRREIGLKEVKNSGCLNARLMWVVSPWKRERKLYITLDFL